MDTWTRHTDQRPCDPRRRSLRTFIIAPLLNDLAMLNISTFGSVLILSVGVNLPADGKSRIKAANLLPSVLFAAIAAYIPFLQ